jgi:hypothetical protein
VETKVPPGWASSVDLMRLAGLTYRQVDHWCSQGYLRPPEPSPGSGAQRLFPPDEIRVAAIMGALVGSGVSVPSAARAARASWGGRWWRAPLSGRVQVSGRLPDGIAP